MTSAPRRNYISDESLIGVDSAVTGLSLRRSWWENPFYFIFGPDANTATAEGFKRREERGKKEDENIKEMTAERLSLFAAHQRGLRQGLAGKDKPTETQSAKSKKFLIGIV